MPVSSANVSAIDASDLGLEAPQQPTALRVQIEMNSEDHDRYQEEQRETQDNCDIESPSSASETTNVEIIASSAQFEYDADASDADADADHLLVSATDGENDVTLSSTSTTGAAAAAAASGVSFHPKHVENKTSSSSSDTPTPTNPRTLIRRQSSKFTSYALKVDPAQEDRAAEIKLCTFARPHMRAFHFAWWCYHVAFLMWFAISPLLGEVQKSLELSTEQIWTSSITAVSSTIIMRFVLGPFCDK